MSRKGEVWRQLGSYEQKKFVQCWTKYLKISNKIKQNWKGLQKSGIQICLYFDYNCQSFITGKETMNQALCLHPNLSFFPVLPNLLRSQVLNYLATCDITRKQID